jgi:hypothetical protein
MVAEVSEIVAVVLYCAGSDICRATCDFRDADVDSGKCTSRIRPPDVNFVMTELI